MEMTRLKISALWTMVMFNITFADIIGFMHPGTLEKMMRGDVGLPITPGMLLAFSVLTEVAIAMIFLNLTLPARMLLGLNTLAVLLTALYVLGGGSATPSYFFFASVELTCMGLLLWYTWKRPV